MIAGTLGVWRVSKEGPRLRPREIEVLTLIRQGLTDRAIGSRLGISEHTVACHVASALRTLHANSRAHAAAVAHDLGLVRSN